MDVARVPDLGLLGDRGVELGEVGGGDGDELTRLAELAPVRRRGSRSRTTGSRVATRRAWPPRGVLGLELLVGRGSGSRDLPGVHRGAASRGLAERHEPRTRGLGVAQVDLRELVGRVGRVRPRRPRRAGHGHGLHDPRELRPLLELHQEVHVAGEGGVGEQLQRDERQRALHHRGEEGDRDQAAQHEQHVAAALLLRAHRCAPVTHRPEDGLGALGTRALALCPVRASERAQAVVEVTDRVGPDLVVARPEDRGGQEGDPRQHQHCDQNESSTHRSFASPTRRQRISGHGVDFGMLVRLPFTPPTPGVRTWAP